MNGVNLWLEDDNSTIIIGKHCLFNGRCQLACTEGKRITFGDDCLISNDVVVRTGDSHSIVDLAGRRINEAKDVTIEDHVWIGNRVIILKGLNVPNNCVIASGCVLTDKKFKSNSILGGVPGNIIKNNINWLYERIDTSM